MQDTVNENQQVSLQRENYQVTWRDTVREKYLATWRDAGRENYLVTWPDTLRENYLVTWPDCPNNTSNSATPHFYYSNTIGETHLTE